MITCSRCGAVAPADSVSCQRCGLLFNQGPVQAGQDQPDLPAWLETLRADRRPTPQTPQAASHPVQMQNAGDMPAWMRTGLAGGRGMTPPESFPSQRPSAMPAPNTDGTSLPPNGLSAGSLIDEQSLPSWMREPQVNEQRSPQNNIPASSLLQPDALPDWLRSTPPQSAPVQPPQSAPLNAPQGPISGNDLIDPQALPPWMTNQPASAVPQPGQNFDAASLIDAGALPSWMRDNHPQQASVPAFPATPPAQPVWQAPAPQELPFNGQMNGQPPVNGLSAASLIDMNTLPDWLKTSDQQQGIPPSPTPFGGAGRDNVRVPSRPRSGMGMGPQEDSAVAANAFLSVLGVASAPNFPAQTAGQYPPAQPLMNAAPAQPVSMPPQPPPYSVPGQQVPGDQAMSMYGGGYQQAPSAMPASMHDGYQGSAPGSMPSYQTNVANAQPEQRAAAEPAKQAKPAKRGIFEALRDWLFH